MISIDTIKKMNKEELTKYAIQAHFFIDSTADYVEELKRKINALEQQIDIEKRRYSAGLNAKTCAIAFEKFCGEMQEKYYPKELKNNKVDGEVEK